MTSRLCIQPGFFTETRRVSWYICLKDSLISGVNNLLLCCCLLFSACVDFFSLNNTFYCARADATQCTSLRWLPVRGCGACAGHQPLAFLDSTTDALRSGPGPAVMPPTAGVDTKSCWWSLKTLHGGVKIADRPRRFNVHGSCYPEPGQKYGRRQDWVSVSH